MIDVECVYVDASALGRALQRAPTGAAVLEALEAFDVRTSSELLRVELRRMAARRGIADESAQELLAQIALVPLDGEMLEAAETVTPTDVSTLDALHLATILRLRENDAVDAVLTYDEGLARACAEHGIHVLSPEA